MLRHFQTWTGAGRPKITAADGCEALYLFEDGAGPVVRNQIRPGVDLWIPSRYVVVDKTFLEPFWKEFSMSGSYWRSALKNIVGFLPVGFVFYAYFLRWTRRRVLLTVLVGTLISLIIEVLQGYLQTRDSGTTDIITNTFGTYCGVVLYRSAITARIAAAFPWLSFLLSPEE